MKRILKPTTIVPQHLYVERSADRQLRNVLDDMGRPGYILVARQMGKTNLLLNMKRERSDDIVLYLDLTNRFATARSWFRNVIDALIEAYPQIFTGQIKEIEYSRKNADLEANVEYDRHLRQLLRATRKKVILVLDEIDSLVNTPYSDTILAQIRSMYFSRTNHQEYERLTYVLSGVAEPTDLIKDKNISPFNIGEKIYLNNFARPEFEEFIKRTLQPINEEVTEAVFSWAAGNPRITWDICAELEILQQAGSSLDANTVSDVVKRLYLTEYDRAPIDHIRTLALSDSSIRSAIVSIRYGKSEFLDPKIRSRLFLSGITNVAGGENVCIANRIVDLALSQEWLDQVNRSQESISFTAIENYKIGNYGVAVEQFEKILDALENDEKFPTESRIALGMSYFHTENPLAAVRELTLALPEVSDIKLTQELQLYIGVAHVTQSELTKGLEYLKSASSGSDTNLAQYAQLEQVPVLLKMGIDRNGLDAIRISTQLIKELEAGKNALENESVSRLVLALYTRAKVYLAMGNKQAARSDIDQAIELSSSEALPTLFLFKYEILESAAEKEELAKNISTAVIDNKITFSPIRNFSLRFNKKNLIDAFLLLDKNGLDEDFDRLASYYVDKAYKNRVSVFSALINLYEDLEEDEDSAKYSPVLARALSSYSSGAPSALDRVQAYTILISQVQGKSIIELGANYIKELSELEDAPADFFSVSFVGAILRLANALTSINRPDISKALFDVWNRVKNSSGFKKNAGIGISWLVFMDHSEMQYRKSEHQIEKAQVLAKNVVKHTEPDYHDQFAGVEWSAALNFRKAALKILKERNFSNGPLREQTDDMFKGLTRNQRVLVKYGNLSPVEKKFKNVEADLRSRVCILVSSKT